MTIFTDISHQIDRIGRPVLERLPLLDRIADHLASEVQMSGRTEVVFICTHNSRRSQLAQIWAAVLAAHFDLPLTSYSGGTEVTAFHPNAIQALQKMGFDITCPESKNPHCRVSFSSDLHPLQCYSKLYNDSGANYGQFNAIMTCSEADEACPNVPGANKRFPLPYEDPGRLDGSDDPLAAYLNTSQEIMTEWHYILGHVKGASESRNV